MRNNFLKQKKYLTGFTLIEVLVAFSLVLGAIMGPVALVARGLFDFQTSKNRLIAAHLAQEGIEAIRLIRENIMFCDFHDGPPVGSRRWDSTPGPGNGPFPGATFMVDVHGIVSNTTCGGVTLSMPDVILGACANQNNRLKLDANGRYTYISGTDTVFNRCLSVCVPASAACNAGADADILNTDQMDVVSTVTWNERGVTKTMVSRERMYNWR